MNNICHSPLRNTYNVSVNHEAQVHLEVALVDLIGARANRQRQLARLERTTRRVDEAVLNHNHAQERTQATSLCCQRGGSTIG